MLHPFLSVLPGQRMRVLVPLAVLALFAWLSLSVADAPLYDPSAPRGILSLALAGDPLTVLWIVKNWENTAVLPMAFLTIGLSFLWLAAASTALSFACVWSAQQLPGGAWRHLGIWLAWAQWLAAGLGVAGNGAMLFLVRGVDQAPWPLAARWCAIGQVTLFAIGLLFALGGIAVRVAVAAMPRRFGYF